MSLVQEFVSGRYYFCYLDPEIVGIWAGIEEMFKSVCCYVTVIAVIGVSDFV